jgi:hypothetical protein
MLDPIKGVFGNTLAKGAEQGIGFITSKIVDKTAHAAREQAQQIQAGQAEQLSSALLRARNIGIHYARTGQAPNVFKDLDSKAEEAEALKAYNDEQRRINDEVLEIKRHEGDNQTIVSICKWVGFLGVGVTAAIFFCSRDKR